MNDNSIICEICKKECSRIYGKHLKSHGLTSIEYKKLYPNSSLYSKIDVKRTSKNSGLHMKEEKYKKMFSVMFSGNNNPNSKSKTTIKQRKKRSPFSKEFDKYKNENEYIEFNKKIKNNITPEQQTTKIEYWLKKGYNEEESKKKLSERQNTFSLKKCILKYGEEMGIKIFNERQKKWSEKIEKQYQKGVFRKTYNTPFSKMEIDLFDIVVEKLNITNNVYYGNNQYFRNFKEIGKTFSYDFVFDKKVIEFNGDYWHCNPTFYNKNYYHKNSIKNIGYEVLIIWENDYNVNKEETIQKCIDFVKNIKNI
jgi:hypothetical protein